jgi:hypothetical protein
MRAESSPGQVGPFAEATLFALHSGRMHAETESACLAVDEFKASID